MAKVLKSTSLVITLVLLLSLVAVMMPALASPAQATTENGRNNHAEEAPPAGGTPCDACGGKMCLTMCSSSQHICCPWSEGWRGNTLRDDVVLVGDCYASPKTTYKLEILAGTEVTGYYGGRVQHLEFRVIEGKYHFSPNVKLSQPAILYELVDGEWVEVLSFTEVLSGNAS